jgi:stress response protein SCP2
MVQSIGQYQTGFRDYGSYICEMKDLMADLIPGIKGSKEDNIAYLAQDDSIELSTLSSSPLTKVSIGCKWDIADGKSIDLDLGCLMLGTDKSVHDFVNFQQLQSGCSSVSHGGDVQDDLEGDGDDEFINISLENVPQNVRILAFYIMSFSGNQLADVDSVSAQLYVTETKRQLVLIDCNDDSVKQHKAILLCMLYRIGTSWYYRNISTFSDGTVLHDNLEHLQSYISETRDLQAALVVPELVVTDQQEEG